MRDAYSHEVISFGFWSGDDELGAPAFFDEVKLRHVNAEYLRAMTAEDVADVVVFDAASVRLGAPFARRASHSVDARLEAYEGWAKYNYHYWRQDYADFLEFLDTGYLPWQNARRKAEAAELVRRTNSFPSEFKGGQGQERVDVGERIGV